MAASYQEPARGPSRRTLWIAAAFAACASASLALLVHPWYEVSTGTNDAAMYLACAKALLAGEGYSYLEQPFTIRPPGFAVFLTPLLAWRGVEFGFLNACMGLWSVACATLLFLYVQPRLGDFLALALACAVWLNPEFRHYSNQLMSDVPGTALLFACLLVERWAERAPSGQGLRRDALLGLCIALAAYVRSVDVLLVPAIVGARALQHALAQRGRGWPGFVRARVLAVTLVPLLLLAPWSVRNTLARPAPPVDQNFLHSYSTAMWHQDGGDPASPRRPLSEVIGRVPERTHQVLSMLGSRMRTRDAGAGEVVLGALAVAALLANLVRRRSSGELWALGTLGVLLVYFGFQERLVLPVALFAALAVLDVALGIGARVLPERGVRVALGAVLAALVALDWNPRPHWSTIEASHAAYTRLCAGFASKLGPRERVASAVGWHTAVYLDRPVHSLFFAVRRAGDVRAVEQQIDKYALDAVVLASAVPADQALLPYFKEHYNGEPVPGGFVFRVRP